MRAKIKTRTTRLAIVRGFSKLTKELEKLNETFTIMANEERKVISFPEFRPDTSPVGEFLEADMIDFGKHIANMEAEELMSKTTEGHFFDWRLAKAARDVNRETNLFAPPPDITLNNKNELIDKDQRIIWSKCCNSAIYYQDDRDCLICDECEKIVNEKGEPNES